MKNLILHLLHNLFKNRKKEIDIIVQTKGAWEAWLQCELANYLYFDKNAIQVLREQNVYTNADRADIICVYKSKTYILELKALPLRSYLTNGPFNTFLGEVIADYNKKTNISGTKLGDLGYPQNGFFMSILIAPNFPDRKSTPNTNQLINCQKYIKSKLTGYKLEVNLMKLGYYFYSKQ